LRPIAVAIAGMALAACQTVQPVVRSGTSDEAHALYTRLTEAVRTCWFSADPAFTAYIYSPEINADAPRILIVPKNDPHGRPVLVIEPKGAATADAYGPLLAGTAGDRVRTDLSRWLKGGVACA